jgi:phage-related protein
VVLEPMKLPSPKLREVKFIGSSRADLSALPSEVKDVFGQAIFLAQIGEKHIDAKPLKGDAFKGSGVMEVVEAFDGNAYRAVYAAKAGPYICVLHAFQKKSTTGIKTPKKEIDLVKKRLKDAKALYGKFEKGE